MKKIVIIIAVFPILLVPFALFAQVSVVDTIYTGSRLFDICVNKTTNLIYTSDEDRNCVFVIDGITNEVIDSVSLVGLYARSIAVSENINTAYVGYYSTDTVSVVDCATNSVVANIPVVSPTDICVNDSTNLVYIACWDSDTSISVIDGATNTVIDVISAGNGGRSISVNALTNRIYVIIQASRKTLVIDGGTNTIIDSITGGYRGICVNELTTRIYIGADVKYTGVDTSTITVVNGLTNIIIDSLIVRGRINDICCNQAANRIYYTTEYPDGFWVIDGNTNTVVDSVLIPAFNVCFNQNTDRIYATTYDSIIYVLSDLTGLEEDNLLRYPEKIKLNAFPSIFTEQTYIKYGLHGNANVNISVYNLSGERIATLLNKRKNVGYRTITWDGTDNTGRKLSSGIYFIHLKSGKYTKTKKVCLIK